MRFCRVQNTFYDFADTKESGAVRRAQSAPGNREAQSVRGWRDVEQTGWSLRAHAEPVPVTLKLRNLPNQLHKKDLVQMLIEFGYTDCYVSLHVPMDTKMRHNAGYAFVNFVDDETATSFSTTFHNYRFPNAKKRCRATRAAVQLWATPQTKSC
mmetsp:Transcript_62303/g.166962  ORF Transcript_62303/g.166962 Transcript_62303/m.166962 type:complete len:154 (+) Transcript_62303:66-527(+)